MSLITRIRDELEIMLIKFDANVIFPCKVRYNRFKLKHSHYIYYIISCFVILFILLFVLKIN